MSTHSKLDVEYWWTCALRQLYPYTGHAFCPCLAHIGAWATVRLLRVGAGTYGDDAANREI